MRKSAFVGIMMSALAASGTLVSGPAHAIALGASNTYRADIDELNVVEKAQFIYEGREHCWYDRGWHGPGWYWCGYAFRRGLGWGGPVGWHGWRHELRREERREERRERRRGY
jgi:hypothetical protein